MKSKRIKRKKLKIKNIIIFIVIIILLIYISFFICNKLINTKINNIYISGNNYVSDIEIIRTANLENYPELFSVSSNKIENKIKNIEIIKNVDVRKNIFGSITIKVNEFTPLFYNSRTDKVILDNNSEIDINNINLPILNTENINDQRLLKKLIKKYKKVNDDIKIRISEIKYDPNSVDDERFLMIMNDGNYIYITLVKIEEINYYLKILPTLENKKGILNLDYGNNFEIIQ